MYMGILHVLFAAPHCADDSAVDSRWVVVHHVCNNGERRGAERPSNEPLRGFAAMLDRFGSVIVPRRETGLVYAPL